MTNAARTAESIHSIEVGHTVRGQYCGYDYAGTVSTRRLHTLNHHITEFCVDLREPVVIFGSAREHIMINASDDLAAAARFVGGAPDTISKTGIADGR